MLLSSPSISVVVMTVAAGVGLLLGYIGQRVAIQRTRHEAEERTRHLLHEAEKEAESKKREAALEAQASWYQAKASLEQEAVATRLELQRLTRHAAGDADTHLRADRPYDYHRSETATHRSHAFRSTG